MFEKIKDRKIVIVNQAANYLTIGLCNSFLEKFENVTIITGSIHAQGEKLDNRIKIETINKYNDIPAVKKYCSYLIATLKIYWLLRIKYRKHEVIFISLPPMGYLLNLMLPHRFSMVIWDVYPDIFKITGMNENNLIFRVWSYLNKKSFKKAYRLFTIGDKLASLISNYVDTERIIVQPIWSIFQDNLRVDKTVNPFVKANGLNGKFVVQYSGNIGLTHKAEIMILLAEQLKNEPGIIFQIIGRGARVPYLKKLVEDKKLPNCVFLPFQSDEMFPYSLSAADLGVVVLDELTSKGSIPSKSYNLMSMGIPALYISAPDSELNGYAMKYGHAKCVSEKELNLAGNFILELYRDKGLWMRMSCSSIKASKNFRRNNADKFVAQYLNI
jgi:hypothetical protein